MNVEFVNTLLMPIALGIIMLGLGLSLTIDDFKRVAQYPKAVALALACQMFLLPVVCFFIAKLFGLSPVMAVGLMLLSATPGGATANLYSHLSHGDVVLNITLTAVNSVLSLFTLPFIINFSLEAFMGEGRYIPLQFGKVISVFAIVLLPVILGMWIRQKSPNLSERMNKPVRIFSVLFLLFIILFLIVEQYGRISAYVPLIGGAALAFNLCSLAIGYFVPLLFRIPQKQSIAIGMEIGIHNGTLAIAIATSPILLNNMEMSIPAAIYSLIMFITAGIFGVLVNLKQSI
jgi:BASS family bile acid:Na+ symporter